MVDVTRHRADLERHIESMVDSVHSMGPDKWLETVEELIASTDNMMAKDMLQTLGLFVMFKITDKIKQLDELEGDASAS